MSRFSNLKRPVGLVLVLGGVLAGCSDIYYDRRETISFGAADAVAVNTAVQVVDPWPRAAANRDHATSGAVVASAVGRYRTGRVIRPRGTGSSSAGFAPQQAGPSDAGAAPPPAK